VYIAQLTELLTNYGELQEVWFDGANGEGPNGKRQTYDWPRIWGLVRERQPRAVIFSDAGPDVRWIGNERGVAGETCWSTIRSSAVPYIGASGDDVITALQQGHADGDVWRPGETDVSIRPGWFYHAAEDAQVRTVENLISLYFTSVGRNSKLLLNVPPTREGVFHSTDVERLRGMAEALNAMRAQRLVASESVGTALDTQRRVHALRVSSRAPITVLELGEQIEQGQHITSWQLHADRVDGPVVAAGTTMGYRQLRRVAPLRASRLYLVTTALDQPTRVTVRAYAG
jgi:alpha-L-fucosidase